MQIFTWRRAGIGVLLGSALLSSALRAQQHPMQHDMADMPGMHHMPTGPLDIPMNRMGSGTTWIPDAVPIPTWETMAGDWGLMAHGIGFVQYDNQGGPRGSDQFGSLNWTMLMASHSVRGNGLFQARTMLSLEPATVTSSGYPLLLQTGESNDDVPLHDRQHPHDFWMELAALYEAQLTSRLGLELYVAPAGEPALGPVAYMHRPSAFDNPLAPISHHWQDATHVTFGVVTAGIFTKRWKLEGSAFNGREPDEERWNFDPIRLDSYSGRLTVNPDSQWSVSASYGFLNSPERLEPGVSLHRVTASVSNSRTLGANGSWASSLIWGANVHSGSGDWSNSGLLESEAILDRKNTIFGRLVVTEKSVEELVLPVEVFSPDTKFNVATLSLGYIRELARVFGATAGLGLTGTLNRVPGSLEPFYGSRTPLGGLVFVRLRPVRAEGMKM